MYDRYFNKLVAFAYGILRNQAQAEDIAHDSFLSVLKNANQFDDTKKFSTWMFTIVKNNCINHINTNQRRKNIVENVFANDTTMQTHINYDKQLIQNKIATIKNQMSDKDKLVYRLRIEQELSIKEVAAIANIPEGTVKSSIFYSLKKIASQLKIYTNE